MENELRNKNRKGYIQLRRVYDFTMAALILAMGVVFVFGDKFGLDFIMSFDTTVRYPFGGLCFLYGAFRVYRGFKHDY
jgi:uncharacterized membrane protein YgdD (TMEM256/DUF423 family)